MLVSACAEDGYKKKKNGWVYAVQYGIGGSIKDFPVENADAETFRILQDDKYAADRNSVYYRGTKISGALPASFRHLKGVYWVDDAHVYFEGEEASGADPKTFEVLRVAPWARDSKSCFRASMPVPGADPKTFSPVNFCWARDRQHYYAFDHTSVSAVRCDYKSMKILSETYAKDISHAFWLSHEIPGVDIESFELAGPALAKDKFRRYSGPKEYWADKQAGK